MIVHYRSAQQEKTLLPARREAAGGEKRGAGACVADSCKITGSTQTSWAGAGYGQSKH